MEKILFLDLETTGFAKELPKAKILELGALAVSIPDFEVVASVQGVVRTTAHDLGQMKLGVQAMHNNSGLWEAVDGPGATEAISLRALEERAIVFVLEQGLQGSIVGGFGPDFDRRFLEVHMPELNDLLHYRNFDANAFWLLRSFVTGEDATRKKPAAHRALDDCRDAVQAVKDHIEFMAEFLGLNEVNARLTVMLERGN